MLLISFFAVQASGLVYFVWLTFMKHLMLIKFFIKQVWNR